MAAETIPMAAETNPMAAETIPLASNDTLEMTQTMKSKKIGWDKLLEDAAKQKYGERIRLRKAWITGQDKKKFLDLLFSDAKCIDDNEPEEISKIRVDVNEKVYSNDGPQQKEDDETTVKIVNTAENTEGHNYTQETTKGLEWGANANIGLQFGLPQFGTGVKGGIGGGFKKFSLETQSYQKRNENKVGQAAHHEEKVKIPAGTKVIVRMTSYRVRYKLDYTMEYKISKRKQIRISFDRLLGLPCCAGIGYIEASLLLQELPGYREDEEFVYFTQEGELRWTADRMDVKKTVYSLREDSGNMISHIA